MDTAPAPSGRPGGSTALLRGRGDLDDQRWLAQQVATLGDGIEAARAIRDNWTDLRNVGRFHPGQSCGDFIASQLGGVRLDLPRLIAALPDMSTREIAKVAGVSHMSVARERAVTNVTPDEPPARVIGADGKSYPGRVVGTTTAEVIEPEEAEPADREAVAALRRAIEAVSAVSGQFKPAELAEAMVPKDRPRMWRELRRAGSFLAQIALLIEAERDA